MAEAVGVSRATYANYECGRRLPDIEVLVKLAEFYGITLDELVGHNKNGSDNMLLMPRDRELLKNYHKISDKMQKIYLAHMKLDVKYAEDSNKK